MYLSFEFFLLTLDSKLCSEKLVTLDIGKIFARDRLFETEFSKIYC